MNGTGIEVLLSSDSSYEKLIAEIYYDGKFIALLNQDAGIDNIKIEFPSSNVQENMVLREIDLVIFEEALNLAKQKLSELKGPETNKNNSHR